MSARLSYKLSEDTIGRLDFLVAFGTLNGVPMTKADIIDQSVAELFARVCESHAGGDNAIVRQRMEELRGRGPYKKVDRRIVGIVFPG